jgi:protocatechuate 3,4-dioxygenase beta subunit
MQKIITDINFAGKRTKKITGWRMKIYEGIFIVLFLLQGIFFFIPLALAQERLVKTPADYEGPFYPHIGQQDEDNDLVHVTGHCNPAKGDILNLSGVVLNTKGEPRKNLIIEIWQTDPQGRYNHPGDTSPGQRDPDFQYWGKAITGNDGTFFFKTLVPGAYHPRPAHIHYKIWEDDKVLLTSQIYINTSPDASKPFSATPSTIKLQTITLKPVSAGVFKGFFQIVL